MSKLRTTAFNQSSSLSNIRVLQKLNHRLVASGNHLIIMCIIPAFAVRINQGIIFFIIFVCMLFLNVLDVEGHQKRMQKKRDLKEKREEVKGKRFASEIMSAPEYEKYIELCAQNYMMQNIRFKESKKHFDRWQDRKADTVQPLKPCPNHIFLQSFLSSKSLVARIGIALHESMLYAQLHQPL